MTQTTEISSSKGTVEVGSKFINRHSTLGTIVSMDDDKVMFRSVSCTDFPWRSVLLQTSEGEPVTLARPGIGSTPVESQMPTATFLNTEGLFIRASALEGFTKSFMDEMEGDISESVASIVNPKSGSTDGSLSIRVNRHLRELEWDRHNNLPRVLRSVIDLVVQRDLLRLKKRSTPTNNVVVQFLDSGDEIWERLLLGSAISTRQAVKDRLLEAAMNISVEQDIEMEEARRMVCEMTVDRILRTCKEVRNLLSPEIA